MLLSSASYDISTSAASQFAHNQTPFTSLAFDITAPLQDNTANFVFNPNLFPAGKTVEQWNSCEQSHGHAVDIPLHTPPTSTFVPDELASTSLYRSIVLDELPPLSGFPDVPHQQDWTIEGMGLEWLFDQPYLLTEENPVINAQGPLIFPYRSIHKFPRLNKRVNQADAIRGTQMLLPEHHQTTFSMTSNLR